MVRQRAPCPPGAAVGMIGGLDWLGVSMEERALAWNVQQKGPEKSSLYTPACFREALMAIQAICKDKEPAGYGDRLFSAVPRKGPDLGTPCVFCAVGRRAQGRGKVRPRRRAFQPLVCGLRRRPTVAERIKAPPRPGVLLQ